MIRESPRAAWLPYTLFVLMLGGLLWLLLAHIGTAVHDTRSDDFYYLNYMTAVSRHGPSVWPSLFEQWNSVEQHWIYPPPSRVGFIAVSALWAKLFGASFMSLSWLSMCSHVVLVLVNYTFARRHFGEPRALFVAALTAFSALLLGLSRLALTDSFIALCMSLTVWLFLELALRPGSLPRGIAFAASFAFTVLVKELAVLLTVPFALSLLHERFLRGEPVPFTRFALTFLAAGLLTVPAFVLAAGGIDPLAENVRIVLASPGSNPYAVQYGSGPWQRYLIDYLAFSPGPTLLAAGFFAVLLLRLRRGEHDRALVLLAILSVSMLAMLSFFTKNIRYMVVLQLPIAVFASHLLVELAGKTRRPALLAGAAVALLCWLEVRTYEKVWIERRMYDPVTFEVLQRLEMLPPLRSR